MKYVKDTYCQSNEVDFLFGRFLSGLIAVDGWVWWQLALVPSATFLFSINVK